MFIFNNKSILKKVNTTMTRGDRSIHVLGIKSYLSDLNHNIISLYTHMTSLTSNELNVMRDNSFEISVRGSFKI